MYWFSSFILEIEPKKSISTNPRKPNTRKATDVFFSVIGFCSIRSSCIVQLFADCLLPYLGRKSFAEAYRTFYFFLGVWRLKNNGADTKLFCVVKQAPWPKRPFLSAIFVRIYHDCRSVTQSFCVQHKTTSPGSGGRLLVWQLSCWRLAVN